MRCPACDARNIDQAGWCTQCFASLTNPPDLAPVPASGGPRDGGEPAELPGPVVATTPVTAGDIRERDGEVEWRCRSCGGWARLTDAHCTVCGSIRRGFGGQHGAGAGKDIAVGTAVAGSLLLPGLGHVLAGAVGSGLARILLWSLWAGAGVGTLTIGAAGRATGAILLVGAAVLWVVSAVDAATLASGTGRLVLEGRRFAVLVAVVTAGLILAAAFAAFGAVG